MWTIVNWKDHGISLTVDNTTTVQLHGKRHILDVFTNKTRGQHVAIMENVKQFHIVSMLDVSTRCQQVSLQKMVEKQLA